MEWRKYWQIENELHCATSEKQIKRRGNADMIANDDIDKILRYETQIEKGLYRAFHELQRMQSARLGLNNTAPIAIDVDLSEDK